MARRVDIAEVARIASVSKSTVSRVLNGGYASPEVKARVMKIVQKLGYTPWTTARNFSLSRAGCVGLVIEDTQSEWITEILGAVEQELNAKHISLLVGSLVLRGTYDATTVLSWIRERRVDGLILARPGKRERPLIDAAREANVGMALISPDETFKGVTSLRSRNAEAGKQIAEHLFSHGHRRIAYVGPKEAADSRQRLKGLEEGLNARKVKLLSSNVVLTPRYHPDEAFDYAAKWLKMPRTRRPTAVVLANDLMALAFMRSMHIQGVNVPKDVSVVGFDDIPLASIYWPGLTTARQPLRSMGVAACQLLTDSLEETLEDGVIWFPAELIVRGSTGFAPNH